MEEIKKIIKKREVVEESYVISGRVLDLLKHYASTVYLGNRKHKILELIFNNEKETSIGDISEKFGMSKPLLSYYMNGNYNHQGMVDSELVDAREINGKTYYKITDFGRFIFEFAKVTEKSKKIRWKKNAKRNNENIR